jgi:hypothetical protein
MVFLVSWGEVIGSRNALHHHVIGASQAADVVRGYASPVYERWNNPDHYYPALWAALRPIGGDS